VNRIAPLVVPALAALLLAGVVAGCGSGKSATSIYSRSKTHACLADKDLHLGPATDFVASTATGGSLKAHFGDGNFVTVAFGRTLADANNIQQAYVNFAARNVGIADVLRQQGNAVMLWHEHPSDADVATVTGCLE
jgi:hypothetical protein